VRVVRALLDQGLEVTALIRPDTEDKLGPLRYRVNLVRGDAWNPASLKGRAHGHQTVVHLMGGTRPVTSLFVLDADRRPLGLLHIHDLLRAGVA